MSCTFDTNIPVYTLGQPADVKRQRAQSLIIRGARRQTAVPLLQSLAEFSYVATRKFGVSVALVRRRVDGWCGGFPVQPAAEPDLAALGRAGPHHRPPAREAGMDCDARAPARPPFGTPQARPKAASGSGHRAATAAAVKHRVNCHRNSNFPNCHRNFPVTVIFPTLSETMHEAVLDAYGRAIHF